MNQVINKSALLVIFISANLIAICGYAMSKSNPTYEQGYEDGYIYTAQQTGKGCKGRLSQAAVNRLDQSLKVTAKTDGDIVGDGDGDGDGAVFSAPLPTSDYNYGKMRGMSDALAAPGDGSDLCTNGD